jgi:hypothetical protein
MSSFQIQQEHMRNLKVAWNVGIKDGHFALSSHFVTILNPISHFSWALSLLGGVESMQMALL